MKDTTPIKITENVYFQCTAWPNHSIAIKDHYMDIKCEVTFKNVPKFQNIAVGLVMTTGEGKQTLGSTSTSVDQNVLEFNLTTIKMPNCISTVKNDSCFVLTFIVAISCYDGTIIDWNSADRNIYAFSNSENSQKWLCRKIWKESEPREEVQSKKSMYGAIKNFLKIGQRNLTDGDVDYVLRTYGNDTADETVISYKYFLNNNWVFLYKTYVLLQSDKTLQELWNTGFVLLCDFSQVADSIGNMPGAGVIHLLNRTPENYGCLYLDIRTTTKFLHLFLSSKQIAREHWFFWCHLKTDGSITHLYNCDFKQVISKEVIDGNQTIQRILSVYDYTQLSTTTDEIRYTQIEEVNHKIERSHKKMKMADRNESEEK